MGGTGSNRWRTIAATTAIVGATTLVVAMPSGVALAATITVTTTADTLDADVSCAAVTLASLPGPDGQTSLREAVCAANTNAGGDTIQFSVNGTFTLTGAANEDNGGTGDLDVKQSLAVVGNGTGNTRIDGNGSERIFDVFPSAATTFDLSGLTLQNGDTRLTSFKEGGALYLHNNVTTTLDDVSVENNFSGANGAIENRGTLTITNSSITGNQTIPASGSVVAGGLRTAGTTTIVDSTIANNTVRGEGGGIAINVAAGTIVTITNSAIYANSASVIGGGLGNGGGISTTGNQGTIVITNTTFSANAADSSGGGAYWVTPGGGTGNVTLTNATITNNTADIDNNGSGTGGGFAQNTALVTLRNTIVAGNFNSNASARDDIGGTVNVASSHNLVGDGTGSAGVTNGVNNNQVGSGGSPIDPVLGGLGLNGGPTPTHDLQAGSPAINTGNNAVCPATDQRGTLRSAGGVCDIGAYELVDAIPPDTTITSNPTNPSASSTGAFTFTGSDSGGSGLAGFQCQIDGGGFSSCTSPQTYLGLSDGPHTFQVRAVDGAGNLDPTPASFTWVIDTTAPDTTITSNPANPTSSTTAGFSFTGFDFGGTGVASFQCQLDGGGFSSCTSPQTYTGLADGSHTFQVRAIDAAGNVDLTPASFTWVIDSVGPDTTITGNPTNPTTDTTGTFTFTGNDGSGTGVASFECSVDSGGFTACTSPFTTPVLADGSHTFQVRAIDAVGTADPTPASYTWVIDTTAPDTAIDSSPTDPSNDATPTFTFSGSDPGGSGVASFECQIDSGGFSACTSPQTYPATADGTHTFEVRALDAAGNVDATPASFTWVIDTVPPVVTITSTPPNPSNSTNATFVFGATDTGGSGVASFECQIDGGGFSACTSPFNLTALADGSHTFQVRATDNAGNTATASYTWTIDATPPETSITSTPANPSNSGDATFEFTGTDSGGGVASFQCQLDGGAFAACVSPVALSGLADGSHTFAVRAIDNDGNIDPSPATYTWVIDTTAPDTTITGSPPAASASASASFSFTANDGTGTGVASFECSLDSAAFAACTSPAAYTGLADGPHTFAVRATDNVGNVEVTPATLNWLVDTAAPNTTITATPPSPTTNTSATVTFSGTDPDTPDPQQSFSAFIEAPGSGVASFQCSLDGAAFTTCTSPLTLTGLSVGSHTLQVRAVDAAGNVDPAPASATWVVIAQVPPTTNPSTGPLPPTGSSAGTSAQVALVLLGAGLVLLLGVSRRRNHTRPT